MDNRPPRDTREALVAKHGEPVAEGSLDASAFTGESGSVLDWMHWRPVPAERGIWAVRIAPPENDEWQILDQPFMNSDE